MKHFLSIIIIILTISACHSQTKKINPEVHVGGPCEGCEAIYEYNNKTLSSIDTLPDFHTTEPKLELSGIVYETDGKTPAEDIILYIYHTNRNGLYINKSKKKGWAERHGSIRGWVKTGRDGRYTFYTFRPAAYPTGTEVEHIHITITEPYKNEYYMDSFIFDDDPLLTSTKRKQLENRNGSGIVTPKLENGIYRIKRDIILGLNIPNY